MIGRMIGKMFEGRRKMSKLSTLKMTSHMTRRSAVVSLAAACATLSSLTAAWTRAQTTSATPEVGEPVETDVYVAGQDGYHTYRIPSVILTAKGTLLAFAEARREGRGDAGDIDLVVKRSTDGGATWAAMKVIGDNGQGTFGNPCPVIDRQSGTIWLLTTQNLGEDKESQILDGTSKGGRTVWVMHSTDDGVTWSAPKDISASVKKADWTWYATGPGAGIQTSSGRLVIPANHALAGTKVHQSHLFYSDDRGKTWTLGGIAADGTNESQVVELADGRLMLNMRNHPPKQPENVRMVAISTDGGRTLGETTMDRALIEPPAQASLLRYSLAVKSHGNVSSGRNRLLFANPAASKRERMTVRLSYDEGSTWPVSRVVHNGPAAYSSLVVLRDRTIGLLYERGAETPYERITFTRFTLGWLTNGEDTHPESK
jgi:sialidase-1